MVYCYLTIQDGCIQLICLQKVGCCLPLDSFFNDYLPAVKMIFSKHEVMGLFFQSQTLTTLHLYIPHNQFKPQILGVFTMTVEWIRASNLFVTIN